MANEQPKESGEETSQTENIKDSDKINKEDVNLNNDQDNEKDTVIEANSKDLVNEGNNKEPPQSEDRKDSVKVNKQNDVNTKKDNNEENVSKISKNKYSSKFPRKRSISPKFHRVSRSSRGYEDYGRFPKRYSLSPPKYDTSLQRYDKSLKRYRMLLRGKSRSPMYSELEYRHVRTYNRSLRNYESYDRSPERYDRSPEYFYSPEIRRSSSPLQIDILRTREVLRRYSRSPIRCYEREKNDKNTCGRHGRLSPTNKKDENCAKIMSVMETGLVPPGMEAEYDLSSLDLPNKSSGRSVDRNVVLEIEKNVSRRHSHSPIHGQIQPEKIQMRYRHSAISYRKRSHSPLRRQSPSRRKYERCLDEIEDKFANKSAKYENRFVQYRSSRESTSYSKRSYFSDEREDKLRAKSGYRRNSVSYTRQSSPLTRKSPSKRKHDKPENKFVEKKRKSFLEEIEEKLKLKQSNVNIAHNKPPAPSGLQSNRQFPFLGTSTPQINSPAVVQQVTSHQLNSNQPQMKPYILPQSVGQHGFLQQANPHMPQSMPFTMQHVPQPMPMPHLSVPINHPILNRQTGSVEQNRIPYEKEAFEKLFADKKTTLSECIRLAPKSSDKPMNIQNKINVIARCQEAIKLLSVDSVTDDHFVVTPSQKKLEKPIETSGLCPFKKLPTVRFQFTSKQGAEEKHPMAVWLNRFLVKLGEKAIFDVPVKESTPLPEKSITPESPRHQSYPQKRQIHFYEKEAANNRKSVTSASTQTEESGCRECKRRNSILINNNYTQTNEENLCFDIGCQVNLEDFERPAKSILRKQSIMDYTPAQLLSVRHSPESGNFGPKRQRLGEYEMDENDEYNPYGDDVNSNRYLQETDPRDRITSSSSSRLFSRDRPSFLKPFSTKSLPFGNFDHKLSLDYNKSFSSFNRGVPNKSTYESASTSDNYWNKRY